jgi:phosphoribosylglycinamide formyltransferase-1
MSHQFPLSDDQKRRSVIKKIGIGVLVSGSGSNLQSLIDNIEAGRLDAKIHIVISNNEDAYALKRCRKHNIATAVVDHRDFSFREDFDRQLVTILNEYDVELVVMAGFMRILTPVFFRAFPMRIMNIHPALLPAFPGLHVQQQAIDYGAKFSGCTVHFADKGIDSGPVIIQAVVPVYGDDDADSLAGRILKEEHRIYPQAVQYYAEGRILITGRKVTILNTVKSEQTSLINPPLSET